MPEIVNCPQCQRQLRVPDELLGKPVRCPSCNTMFTAASSPAVEPGAAGTTPAVVPTPAVDDRSPRPTEEWEAAYEGGERLRPPSRQRALNRLKPPAICLLVAGVLGMIVDVGGLALAALSNGAGNPAPIIVPQGQQDPQTQQIIETIQRWRSNPRLMMALNGTFLVISAFAVAASICMLTGRAYPLAVLGSVVAMADLGSCCCVLTLPFGIWSLAVLMDSQVRLAFR